MNSNSYVERLIIKASAGTGKTHNLTGYYLGCLGCLPKNLSEEDKAKFRLEGAPCKPEDIIAVTFTRKAADELKVRLREALLKENRFDEAARVDASYIGTVHSICLRLLQEYALDTGISPVAEELSDEDGAVLFRRAASPLLDDYAYLDELFSTFGIAQGDFGKKNKGRKEPMLDFCRELIALARLNGLEDDLKALGRQSFNAVLEEINKICPELDGDGEAELAAMHEELKAMIDEQKDAENYDWCGRITKKSRDAGNVRVRDDKEQVLSKNEENHIAFMKELAEFSAMSWKNWFSLIERKAGAKDTKSGEYKDPALQDYVKTCTALGRRVFSLPQFRRDVERLITGMFSFAAEAMECFKKAKQNAGVVDFADMERMARMALGKSNVQKRIKDRRFRVLFVDEFQDTSPIQLSIFHLLGQLIYGADKARGRIIYVGDDKQSIYGFRGADPSLTRNCTEGEEWKKISLDVCWRSLPELCDFTNAFFNQVENGLRTSLLGEARTDEHSAPKTSVLAVESVLKKHPEKAELYQSLKKTNPIIPLHFWLTGKEENANGAVSKAEAFNSLAWNIAGLCGLLDAQGRIQPNADKEKAAFVSRIAKLGDSFTKDELGTRAVEPRDIAILCRYNKDCVAVADALEQLGIPAAAEREGLLEQDDVAFCLNAFRLALDTGDKLAAAELHLVINGGDAWFEAASKKQEDADSLWAGIPFMNKLETLHKKLGQLTPSELLDETLSAADCFRRAAAKARGEENIADLEALRALVREYEQAMHSRRCSATAQGWLDWLEERAPGRASGGQNAVQVWTYHKSKGLERKIVILYGLSDKKEKIDIFQPRVIPAKEISPNDPLEGRTLQWIPNVFGQAVKLEDVKDTFHAWKEAREKEQVEESQRLLYVGMTRACDMLILAANLTQKGISSPWLAPFICEKNDANDNGELQSYFDYAEPSGAPALAAIFNAESGKTAQFCGKDFLVRKTSGIPCAKSANASDKAQIKLFPRLVETVLEEPKPLISKEPVSPEWRPFCGAGADVSGITQNVERDQLGNMLHSWFAVWFGMGKEQREEERSSGWMANRLERFCALWNDAFTPPLWSDAGKFMIPLSDALEKAVLDWFNSEAEKRPGDELVIRTEWPLEHRLEESAKGITASRLDSMRVDLMAEVRHADGTAGPCLIVDHKCGNYGKFGDDMENLARHLTEAYGQRQSEYIRALHAMGRECQCWLHLPLEGRMLEFKLNNGDK
ncbi:UvrD-helicase domain-containing protein [Mailhella sp.]